MCSFQATASDSDAAQPEECGLNGVDKPGALYDLLTNGLVPGMEQCVRRELMQALLLVSQVLALLVVWRHSEEQVSG